VPQGDGKVLQLFRHIDLSKMQSSSRSMLELRNKQKFNSEFDVLPL